MAICPHCQRENPVISAFCPACGGAMQEKDVPEMLKPVGPPAHPALMPMKWYKFLIYFSLPLSFIMNVLSLIDTIPLLKNFQPSDYLPGLADMVYIHSVIGIGITAITLLLILLAEIKLYKRQWPGVRLLLAMYLLQALYSVVMIVFLLTMATPTDVLAASIVAQLMSQFIVSGIGMIVMFLLNRTYFRKRKALFSSNDL